MIRPILFSGEMVKAILEGRKTQTRRTLRLPANIHPPCDEDNAQDLQSMFRCPYGKPGDHLWVRETCWLSVNKDAVMYLDGGGKVAPTMEGTENWAREWKACPSIHMPRWASRITLEIVSVRVERLQDISHENAISEGFYQKDEQTWGRLGFSQLWDKLNVKRGFGWHTNPWVWVIEFSRIN